MSFVKKRTGSMLFGYTGLVGRAWRRFAEKWFGIDRIVGVRIHERPMSRIGDDEYGWYIPSDFLFKGAICYCGGAGENISFDQELARRGAIVHTFDPTPRAKRHFDSLGETARGVFFHDIGLWSVSMIQKFYAPKNRELVSHSILNIQKTNTFFEARCERISDIMHELGHDHLDLLKLDIEGAEYEVIRSVVEDKLPVGILCVEFDEIGHPIDRFFISRIRNTVRLLARAGYTPVRRDGRSNYTFVSDTNRNAAR